MRHLRPFLLSPGLPLAPPSFLVSCLSLALSQQLHVQQTEGSCYNTHSALLSPCSENPLWLPSAKEALGPSSQHTCKAPCGSALSPKESHFLYP